MSDLYENEILHVPEVYRFEKLMLITHWIIELKFLPDILKVS